MIIFIEILELEGNDMNYFDMNLKEIQECKPGLYKKLKHKIVQREYDLSKFNILDAKDGEKIVEIKNDNDKVRLNSIYSPKKEAEKWIKQFKFNDLNISVIMFGIVNGIYARLIVNNLKGDEIAIFFEPDLSLFIYCITNFDMTDILGDYRTKIFIKNVNDDEFYFCLQRYINAVMISTQIVCAYPKLENIYESEALKFKTDIKEKYRLEIVLTYALKEEYKAGIQNAIKNLHFIKKSNYSQEFVGCLPENVPVIIVCSGPSLDKNIGDLKKAYGKSVILVVDTAVKYMIQNKVNFDAIVTIDMLLSMKHLENKKSINYPIFATIKSNNMVLENNKSRKIWMITSDFMAEIYKKSDLGYPEWTTGGSVATDAFELAEKFGTKRIILVGQDLAFSDEKTHAGGVVDYSNEYNEDDIAYVEGINGQQIKTRGDWLRFLYWFNGKIAELENNIEVIDATEGGAKIQGTRIMKLSEAIDKYCCEKFEFSDIITNMPPTFSQKTYASVKKNIMHMENELMEIKVKSQFGIKLSEQMIYLLSNDKVDKDRKYICINKIKEINKYIEEQLVYILIRDYVEANIHDSMEINCFSGNKKNDEIKSFELSKQTFEVIINVVNEIMPIMKEEFQKL